jgi:hypothetical protein
MLPLAKISKTGATPGDVNNKKISGVCEQEVAEKAATAYLRIWRK